MFNPMVNNGGIPVSSVVENKEAFVFGNGENENNNQYTLDKFYRYIELLILHDSHHCLNKNIKNIINKIKDERHIITNIPAKCLQRYHYERPVEIYKEFVKSNKIFNHSRCKHDKINNNPMFLESLDYLKNVIINNNCVPQEHKPEKKESKCMFGFCSKKNKTTDNDASVDFGELLTSKPVKQAETPSAPQGSSVPQGSKNPSAPQVPSAFSTFFDAKVPKTEKDSSNTLEHSVPSVPLNPFEHCVFSASFGAQTPSMPQGSSNPSVPSAPQVPSNPFGAQAPRVHQVPQGSSNPSAPSVPAGFTGFEIPEPSTKDNSSQGVQNSCEQHYRILNLDTIASLKLNYNLDYAVRAIVAYRVSGSLDSLQRAIQYLNNELENNKTK